jgi:hypothetical protein
MPPSAGVPVAFDTSEFRRSDGPLEHNAASAWNLGRTGRGVTIAVIDGGIDEDSPEFAGRLSPLSRDMLGSRPLTGPDDHGTNVAMIAAAARDNAGILGIAFDATVMALRSDTIGSCGGADPQDPGTDCTFSDSTIAAAINYASTNGAKVINISLGGEGADPVVLNAASAAANRGTLIIVAAGNAGSDQPESFARLMDQAGSGGVIIVGSVDADGSISSFSNRAGPQNTHFMTALGSHICCSYENGQLFVDNDGYRYLFSGTSFSAPQVAGAAALLAQAFPNLTGRDIADILLRSAFDVGTAGTDAVYGRGILDIARAFQPLGTTSLAGGTEAVLLGDSTGTGSSPMGDALTGASLPAIVLDEYERAFQADLAGTLRGAAPEARLRRAVGTSRREVSLASKSTSLALSIDDRGRLGELRLGERDADRARVLAARITTRLAPDLQLGFGYAESAHGLVAQLQGQDRPAFLIAPEASGEDGARRLSEASLAVRKKLGPWGLTLSAEQGQTVGDAENRRAAQMTGRRVEDGAATYGVALDRRFGAFDAALGLTWLDETDTLLGARFHDAFGLSGADTLFLDAQAGWHLAPRWRLGAAFRQGWTRAHEQGLVAPGSSLVSRAWSVDLERRGVFSGSDRLGLRLSQPLRVERGALNLSLPVDYSYETLLAQYGTRSLALAPRGRELLGELAWSGPVLGGYGAASLFYRRDPGHYEAVPNDAGAALRWSKRF